MENKRIAREKIWNHFVHAIFIVFLFLQCLGVTLCHALFFCMRIRAKTDLSHYVSVTCALSRLCGVTCAFRGVTLVVLYGGKRRRSQVWQSCLGRDSIFSSSFWCDIVSCGQNVPDHALRVILVGTLRVARAILVNFGEIFFQNSRLCVYLTKVFTRMIRNRDCGGEWILDQSAVWIDQKKWHTTKPQGVTRRDASKCHTTNLAGRFWKDLGRSIFSSKSFARLIRNRDQRLGIRVWGLGFGSGVGFRVCGLVLR